MMTEEIKFTDTIKTYISSKKLQTFDMIRTRGIPKLLRIYIRKETWVQQSEGDISSKTD